MKKIMLLLFLAFTNINLSAQDITKCRKLVDLAVNAVNSKSSNQLEEHLAPNFTISKVPSPTAVRVLNILVAQLDDTILSKEEKSTHKDKDLLTLNYTFHYKKLGQKEASFVFNKQNQFVEISLLKIEVQTKTATTTEEPTQYFIDIPFQLVQNLLVVNVIIDGQKRPFLFDSGSPSVVLNAKYFSQKDTSTGKRISSSKGVNGQLNGLSFYHVKEFDFQGIKIKNQKHVATDLDNIEKELNTPIYGLIGYSLIKNYDVLYDYKNKIITLIQPEFYAQYATQTFQNKKTETIPFQLKKHIPILPIKIKNREYAVGVDSGAETNMLDDDLFSTISNLKKIGVDTLSGVGNQSRVVKKGIVKKMSLGTQKYKNVPFVFGDLSHINKGYKLQLDGLIGYEILSKQLTLISYKRKEMILFLK